MLRRLAVLLLATSLLPTKAAALQQPIKVMSFNIRYGTADDGDDSWGLRRLLVFESIRAAGPHVVGIQEALDFQLRELVQWLPHYTRVGVGRDDGATAGEYAAILYDRERFELLNHDTFWFSDTPDVPGSTSWGNTVTRICTWVHLRDRDSGEGFYVYNVHWDHESQNSREMSARLLVERIADREVNEDPVIVMGDFNAGESNPAFVTLTSSGLRDTYRLRHPRTSDVGTFNGFRGTTDGEKIDAVLVSAEWFVIAAEIIRDNRDGRYPSDHFPVVAEIVSNQ